MRNRARKFSIWRLKFKTARDKVEHLHAHWHELELLQSVPYP